MVSVRLQAADRVLAPGFHVKGANAVREHRADARAEVFCVLCATRRNRRGQLREAQPS